MLTQAELMAYRDLLEHQLADLERKAGGTVSDLLLNSIGAADLLEISEVQHFHAVATDLPAQSPGAQGR